MTRGRPPKYLSPRRTSVWVETYKEDLIQKLGKSIADALNLGMDTLILDAIQSGNPAFSPDDVRKYKRLMGWQIDDALDRVRENQERAEARADQMAEDRERYRESVKKDNAPPEPDGPDPLDALTVILAPQQHRAPELYERLQKTYSGPLDATTDFLKAVRDELRQHVKMVDGQAFEYHTSGNLKPLEQWIKLIYYESISREATE